MENKNDAVLKTVYDKIKDYEKTATIVNETKVEDVMKTFTNMRKVARDCGAKASYKLHEPFSTSGAVTLTGEKIVFKDTENFIEAASVSRNFEAYPKTDGTVAVTFTFSDLMIPEEQEVDN